MIKTVQFTLVVFLIATIISCDQDGNNTVEPPKGVIPVKVAQELQTNFLKTREGVINAEIGYQDSREVWWSIDELKQYIAYVEQESAKQGKKNLGLRVYFGATAATMEYKNGLSTLFFVPTFNNGKNKAAVFSMIPPDDGDENNYEIDPLNRGTVGDPPIGY